MITKLYKGEIELNFDEKRHWFTVNGKSVLSVTGATSVIDKSRPLIYWATGLAKDYLLANLKTMIGDGKGDKIAALIEEAVIQHQLKKQEAADIGTEVHDWAEYFIKSQLKISGYDCKPVPKDPAAANGVTAFLRWIEEYNVKFVSSERQIYSKKHKYAGIMDAEAIIQKKLSVVDFKTSKGIYSEYRFQVAGYQGAAEEESGKDYPGNKWLARFGKTDGEFEAHEFAEHDKDYAAFLAALALRRRLKELDTYKPK